MKEAVRVWCETSVGLCMVVCELIVAQNCSMSEVSLSTPSRSRNRKSFSAHSSACPLTSPILSFTQIRIQITTIILTLVLNPECLKIAQAEIDAVITAHEGQLPTTADRASLPYLHAIIKEAFRWHPPSPVAIPHYLHQNDTYRGYRMPSGFVYSNFYAITRDESLYPDPERFDPTRFLGEVKDRQLDPTLYVYGVGRRTCPGMAYADMTVYIILVRLLACFEFLKKRDSEGRTIEPVVQFSPSLVR